MQVIQQLYPFFALFHVKLMLKNVQQKVNNLWLLFQLTHLSFMILISDNWVIIVPFSMKLFFNYSFIIPLSTWILYYILSLQHFPFEISHRFLFFFLKFLSVITSLYFQDIIFIINPLVLLVCISCVYHFKSEVWYKLFWFLSFLKIKGSWSEVLPV